MKKQNLETFTVHNISFKTTRFNFRLNFQLISLKTETVREIHSKYCDKHLEWYALKLRGKKMTEESEFGKF